MTRVRVCRCVQVCAFLCDGTPHFSFFGCSGLQLLLPYHDVCITPSSQALYYVAATAQQQSHSKFVWTASMAVLTLRMRVCDVCDDM